ncbi:MAG: hypothetical protein MZW92_02705 [Comamonadaceae bacterium]|nr:hypothetical protein [Comamonadaceae bacterium]
MRGSDPDRLVGIVKKISLVDPDQEARRQHADQVDHRLRRGDASGARRRLGRQADPRPATIRSSTARSSSRTSKATNSTVDVAADIEAEETLCDRHRRRASGNVRYLLRLRHDRRSPPISSTTPTSERDSLVWSVDTDD